MSILVLGGAGYIGSHTVYELIDRGNDVVIVDNLQTGFKELIHPKAKFYQGDLRDEKFLNSVFEKENIEGVIHFAANSLVGVSMKEPLEYYDNNVYGMIVLLKAMRKHKVNHIVFSSTAATYGEPKKVPIEETDDTIPTNPYGETKLAMEHMMKWCVEAFGMSFVALRYFNACGAHPNGLIGELHNPETHLIPLILQVALGKRDAINVFGNDYDTKDGTCIRDYIHVCDLADAHIKALDYLKKGNPSQIINLGNGEGYSVLDIINAVKEVTQQEIKVNICERRSGDPAKLIANNKKALTVLNWTPKYTDINQIISTAWNFYTNRK
ncbi:MAG: UDP-glucose 4-epimerase GalE [Intestinibacter sp.]|uniref:UDP-glucose 4-epimerase GalE n=1 Tax=Intestinibacter sp. TaxID=1965304 RepID=UPI003F1472A7